METIFDEQLIGKRFNNLTELKNELEKLTKRKIISIFESESDIVEDCDNMIDFEFENDGNVYTIYYLFDNAKRYYITEI